MVASDVGHRERSLLCTKNHSPYFYAHFSSQEKTKQKYKQTWCECVKNEFREQSLFSVIFAQAVRGGHPFRIGDYSIHHSGMSVQNFRGRTGITGGRYLIA